MENIAFKPAFFNPPNGHVCAPATCPATAERSDFNLSYTRQLSL